MADNEAQLSQGEIEARSKIGRRIVYWALGAVSVLGLAAIATTFFGRDRASDVRDVLAMVLPMIGAWVGTVLAFYFSRENYMAAAQSSAQLVGLTLDQRLQSMPVESAMIPVARIENRVILSKPLNQMKLKGDVLKGKNDKNRILIFDENEVVRHVVHRSIVDRFVAEKAFAAEKVDDLTLRDLLGDPNCLSWANAFATIVPNRTLDVAKSLMDGTPHCSDLIVTVDGTRDSRAVGWITNAAILEKARA